MAKAPKHQDSSTSALQPAPKIEHTVRLAPPEDLPAILTAMEQEGWQLLHIVSCAGFQHAAYFRRQL